MGLMLLSEGLNLPSCAREFANAGLHALERAFPDSVDPADLTMGAGNDGEDDDIPDAQEAGAARKQAVIGGQLWGNLFTYALADGKYEVGAGLSSWIQSSPSQDRYCPLRRWT